jgi:hypothetical protein
MGNTTPKSRQDAEIGNIRCFRDSLLAVDP